MGKFRFKRAVPVDYDLQGYIYFTSRRYKRLPKGKREKIDRLCRRCGGEFGDAIREFVTTDAGAALICQKYFISQSTLERMVRKYYVAFANEL